MINRWACECVAISPIKPNDHDHCSWCGRLAKSQTLWATGTISITVLFRGMRTTALDNQWCCQVSPLSCQYNPRANLTTYVLRPFRFCALLRKLQPTTSWHPFLTCCASSIYRYSYFGQAFHRASSQHRIACAASCLAWSPPKHPSLFVRRPPNASSRFWSRMEFGSKLGNHWCNLRMISQKLPYK